MRYWFAKLPSNPYFLGRQRFITMDAEHVSRTAPTQEPAQQSPTSGEASGNPVSGLFPPPLQLLANSAASGLSLSEGEGNESLFDSLASSGGQGFDLGGGAEPPAQRKGAGGAVMQRQADPEPFNPDKHGGDAPVQAKGENGVIQRDGESVDDMMEEQAGVALRSQEITLNLTLPANQVLMRDGANTIHTGDDGVRVYVSVNTTGFRVRFSPHLTISHDLGSLLPTVDIDLHEYSWNFSSQTLYARWTAANAVNWFGDPGGEIHSAVQAQMANLPARMSARGYNPFEDPMLLDDLTTLFSTSSGGGSMPQVSHASLGASVVLEDDLVHPAGPGELRIPGGTRISVSVNSGNGIPDDLADVNISSVSLDLSGQGANLEVNVLGEGMRVINLQRVTLSHGGGLSFRYGLVTEDLESLGRLLGMLVQLRTGQDLGVRDLNSSRHEGLRRMIDENLRGELDPMIRTFLQQHHDVVPGVDLRSALGMGGS